MKRGASTASRARRSSGAQVALFPFLAVLMCAMGALALLLVAVNRHSRLQAFTAARNAVAAASPAVSERAQQIQTERESAQWRIEQLQTSRQKTEQQLAEARLKLGHLEDHARRLRTQIAQLQASLAEFEQQGTDRRRVDAAAELEQLKRQLAQAEQQLAETRRAVQARPRSYAVIPFEGPNHTRRRPIYIECRAEAVILQPEGIVFTANDFLGPLDAGNPLEVALRAVREHLLKARAAGGDDGEPYPLLLVRPDGIEAYYMARLAMSSWGTEFGYELIGEDWKLQFPKPNPPLADTVQQAVESARVRQQQIVAAAPRKYGLVQTTPKYRAAPGGGGLIRDYDAEEDERRSGYSTGSWGGSRRRGGAGVSSGVGDRSQAGGASSGAMGTAASTAGGAAGMAANGSGAPGVSAGSGGSAGSTALADPGQTSQNSAVPVPQDFVLGRPPREQEQLQQSPVAERVGRALRPGEWIEQPPPAPKPPENPDDKKKEPPKDKAKVRSLAETRGRDWGLPDATKGSVGITRSMRVDCYQDRLVIGQSGTSAGKTIPLGERTAASIDTVISTVWEHMDSWGIAGKGMYWKPVLNVHVFPNGEARFDELQILLDGSGMEVRRHEG